VPEPPQRMTGCTLAEVFIFLFLRND